MDNIKNILDTVIGKISDRKPQDNDNIQRLWNSLLNPSDINHTRVVDFKSGCLIIHVDSPAKLYQIKLKYRTLVDNLKEMLPDFQKLVLKIGKVL
jgi:hypothetical protein